jgi:hypothetical protein
MTGSTAPAAVSRVSAVWSVAEMPPLAAGDAFPELTVLSTEGPVELRDRWREGPLVVAFMRHFG